ncbi:MAG TPA: rhomboid family intramembrane serine protease [Sphingomonas sp.]
MRISDWRVTAAIAVLTLVISGLVIVNGLLEPAALGWGFVPALASGVAVLPGDIAALPVWLTPLSATLVHGGWGHLALNLIMLIYCGQQAERPLGGALIAALYVIGAYAAAAGQWAQEPDGIAPMIGASGAISAVLGAYAMLFGRNKVKVANPTLALWLHALWLLAAWVALQSIVGVVVSSANFRIAVAAHVGGFIPGVLLARPLLLFRYRRA